MTDTTNTASPSASRRTRCRRRGLTIMEAVFWMGGFAILVASMLGLYVVFTNNQRELQTRQLVQTVIGAVRGLYASNVNYTGLAPAILVNAGEIPLNYVRGTAIETPYGGAVTLGGWDGGWAMGIVNTRTDACIAILSDFVSGTGFHEQVTGAANLAAVPAAITAATATATTIVGSVAAVNTACAAATKNLVIEFR